MPDILTNNAPLIMIGVGAIVIMTIAAVFWLHRPKKQAPVGTACKAHSALLSRSELHALGYLRRAVAGKAYICPKVELGRILNFSGPQPELLRRDVDFVAMSANGTILFAVEIDEQAIREEVLSDEARELQTLFAEAGVSLIHVLPGKLERSDELQFAVTRLITTGPTRARVA